MTASAAIQGETGRELLIRLINEIPEEQLADAIDYVMRLKFGEAEDEPLLPEDDLREIEAARKDIAEGRGIPFDEVIRELW